MNNRNLEIVKDSYHLGIKHGTYNGFMVGIVSGFLVNYLLRLYYNTDSGNK